MVPVFLIGAESVRGVGGSRLGKADRFATPEGGLDAAAGSRRGRAKDHAVSRCLTGADGGIRCRTGWRLRGGAMAGLLTGMIFYISYLVARFG